MKYYIIAGEASGDLHGSNLIKALKKEDTAYSNIKISTGTNLKGLQKKVQARKVKDYIFMVKGN